MKEEVYERYGHIYFESSDTHTGFGLGQPSPNLIHEVIKKTYKWHNHNLIPTGTFLDKKETFEYKKGEFVLIHTGGSLGLNP